MKIEELSLRHFRNWEELEVAPGAGLNLWMAPNGAGKTNLLEALAFLMSGQSPRTRHPSHLVRFESAEALARARLRGDLGEIETEVSCRIEARGRIHFFKNGKEISTRRMRPHFPAVYFSPEEVSVISGEPRIRRDFLDRALKVLLPAYADTLQDYSKALAERNALLLSFHQENSEPRELSVWNEALAAHGAEIIFQRQLLLEKLSCAKASWQEVLKIPGEAILRYSRVSLGMRPEEIARALLARMDDLKDAERAVGQSLVGPHRDEIEISLSGHPARTFGSRGEMRLLSLLLVLSVASLIEEKLGEAPVLLLDDVFSELDETHQSAVAAASSRFQVIATTADVSLTRRLSPQHLVNLALKARVAA